MKWELSQSFDIKSKHSELSMHDYETMIVLEEKMTQEFKSFIDTICMQSTKSNFQNDSNNFVKDLTDYKTSERLTLMFIIFYIFRECLDVLFERIGLNCVKECGLDDPEILDNDVSLYEAFKRVILYLHVMSIRLQYTSNYNGSIPNTNHQTSENHVRLEFNPNKSTQISENILYTWISYSLSMKFLLSVQTSKPITIPTWTPLYNLSLITYIQEHYPKLYKIFEDNTSKKQSKVENNKTLDQHLLEFVSEIKDWTVSKNYESLSISTIINHSIKDLIQMRSIHNSREIKEILEIVSSELIMAQLKTAIDHQLNHSKNPNEVIDSELNPIEMTLTDWIFAYAEIETKYGYMPKQTVFSLTKGKELHINDIRESLYSIYDKYEDDL